MKTKTRTLAVAGLLTAVMAMGQRETITLSFTGHNYIPPPQHVEFDSIRIINISLNAMRVSSILLYWPDTAVTPDYTVGMDGKEGHENGFQVYPAGMRFYGGVYGGFMNDGIFRISNPYGTYALNRRYAAPEQIPGNMIPLRPWVIPSGA